MKTEGTTVRSIVCIKRVPDSEARLRVAADGLTIEASGVKFAMNPYDEFALEEALRLKDQFGEGSVSETLRSALAMGADEGVLLRSEGSIDGLAVARALADEIATREYDLVLFGKQAIDDDAMQVPAMVAQVLGLPCATVVVDLQIAGGVATARREIEGGHEIVEFDLPGVVAAQKGLNDPRYPSLKGIMAAKRKPLEEKDIAMVEPKIELLALTPPPARPEPQIVGEGADAVPELVRRLREEAKVL